VGSRAGIVSDPDAKVLDLRRALLVDLTGSAPCPVHPIQTTYHVQANNLAICLLDLSELHQEVPETRLCNNGVWCKYSHPVQLGCWVCLSGQMAANDLVFRETTYENVSAFNTNLQVQHVSAGCVQNEWWYRDANGDVRIDDTFPGTERCNHSTLISSTSQIPERYIPACSGCAAADPTIELMSSNSVIESKRHAHSSPNPPMALISSLDRNIRPHSPSHVFLGRIRSRCRREQF
jgi:hypothetical protein